MSNDLHPICLTCGTCKESTELLSAGYCINGHDNWLEENDPIEYWQEATNRFNVTIEDIKHVMHTGDSLNQNNT